LGQEASNFADKLSAIQPGASLVGSGTSTSWGNYSTISPLNGKNWLFLGEGTYQPGILPSISNAYFTVYSDPITFSSNFTTTAIIPEPITPTLLTPEYLEHLTAPPTVPVPPAPVVEPEPQPIVVPTSPPANPPNPPVETTDPPPEDQPPEPPIFVPPIYVETELGTIVYSFRAFPIYGGLIDIVQTTDGEVATYPNEREYLYSGLPQFTSEIGAPRILRGSVAYDGLAIGSYIASNMALASYNVAGTALSDQIALDAPAETPEPCGFTLAIVGAFSFVTFRQRRR
jgi:hypothetical protein